MSAVPSVTVNLDQFQLNSLSSLVEKQKKNQHKDGKILVLLPGSVQFHGERLQPDQPPSLAGCLRAARALGDAAAPRALRGSPAAAPLHVHPPFPWHSSVLGLGTGGYRTDTLLFKQTRPLVLAA